MKATGWLAGLAMVAGLAMTPAHAQKSADTLRLVNWTQIPDFNPYYNQIRDGIVIGLHAWDGLTYRDPETFKPVPLLATAWRYVDDTTLEFDLRKGVTFHDGSPFTADDVVFTFTTITADKRVTTPSNFAWMAGAEKVDDYKVRVKLKRIFPAAIEYITMVLPIIPKAYYEKVGAEGYSKAPVGAGPYRITKVVVPSEVDFERFEGYYDGSPKGKPAIGKMVFHEVTDSATALAELLGGRADWTWNFNADNFDNVARMPNLTAVRGAAMRVNFIQFDAAGRTGKDNPLTKEKVRQAIAYAINRDEMAKKLMQGDSRALDTPCFPTQFGCNESAAVRYEYNPDKAKQLLAEAGYPNGLETELVTFMPQQFPASVQAYLRAVGIDAKVSDLQVQAVIQRSMDGTIPMALANWGSYSINDASAFLPFFFTGSNQDYTRDPEVKRLIEQGGSVTDPEERRKAYDEAIKLITGKVYMLPMFNGVVTYGMTKQLNFKPWPDELPRFYLSSWK
jgi:peptide/nickel transport system substrate-binding protein